MRDILDQLRIERRIALALMALLLAFFALLHAVALGASDEMPRACAQQDIAVP